MTLKNIKSLFLILFLVSFGTLSFADPITVKLDRSTIELDESFTLTFSAPSTVLDTPDLTPIEKDFLLLGTQRSQSLHIINGNRTAVTQWSLTLAPKNTGSFTIPSLTFGTIKSDPIKIYVKKNSHDPSSNSQDVFILGDLSEHDAYLQSQITYKVKVFYSVPIDSPFLNEPRVDKAIITPVGQDKQYQTDRSGKTYHVFERTYAIFPQAIGPLHIEAPFFTGRKINPRGYADKFLKIAAQNETIDIKAIPDNWPSTQSWLPSRFLTLSDNWSGPISNLHAGEPITRTISLSAIGIAAAQLPDIQIGTVPGVKIYPEKPQLENTLQDDWIKAQKTINVAYIPTKEGDFDLPPIDLTWFNTKTKKIQHAVIEGFTLPIQASPMITPEEGITPSLPQHEVSASVLSSRLKHLFTSPIFSSLLFVLWLLTVFFFIFKRKRPKIFDQFSHKENETKQDVGAESFSAKQARRALKSACKNSDPLAAKDALIAWSQAFFADHSLKSLDIIAEKFKASSLSEAILELQKFLYAKSKGVWQGEHFWKVFSDKKSYQKSDVGKSSKHALPPLNP